MSATLRVRIIVISLFLFLLTLQNVDMLATGLGNARLYIKTSSNPRGRPFRLDNAIYPTSDSPFEGLIQYTAEISTNQTLVPLRSIDAPEGEDLTNAILNSVVSLTREIAQPATAFLGSVAGLNAIPR